MMAGWEEKGFGSAIEGFKAQGEVGEETWSLKEGPGEPRGSGEMPAGLLRGAGGLLVESQEGWISLAGGERSTLCHSSSLTTALASTVLRTPSCHLSSLIFPTLGQKDPPLFFSLAGRLCHCRQIFDRLRFPRSEDGGSEGG